MPDPTMPAQPTEAPEGHRWFTTKVCTMCGKRDELLLTTLEYYRYVTRGDLAQVAMPDRPADFREQLISGTHPACWEALFGGFEDDEDDEPECEGHPSGPVAGETFYCDGTCA